VGEHRDCVPGNDPLHEGLMLSEIAAAGGGGGLEEQQQGLHGSGQWKPGRVDEIVAIVDRSGHDSVRLENALEWIFHGLGSGEVSCFPGTGWISVFPYWTDMFLLGYCVVI